MYSASIAELDMLTDQRGRTRTMSEKQLHSEGGGAWESTANGASDQLAQICMQGRHEDLKTDDECREAAVQGM